MNKKETNPREAKAWLEKNKNPNAFAKKRFKDTKEALQFIENIYQVGVLEAVVNHVKDDEQRIKEEGGPYADALVIKLPDDSQKRNF